MGPTVQLTACGCCGSAASAAVGDVGGIGLRRCDGCGTVRFSEVLPPEAVYGDGYHDGSAALGWDWTEPTTAAYEQALNDRRVAWIERSVPKGSLADVGGGLGYLAAAAQARGWHATLFEPVGQAARHAEQTFPIEVVHGGVDAVTASGRRFDAVVLSHVLEHLPDAADALRGLRAAIAPAGRLVLEVPNHASLARRWEGERWVGWQPGQHVYVFDRRSLGRLLDRTGYEVERVATLVPSWPGLLPDANAHFLGVERLLHRAVNWRRRRTTRSNGDEAVAPSASPSVPATELRGVRRALFGTGFEVLRRVEERLGLGTNLRVVARPR